MLRKIVSGSRARIGSAEIASGSLIVSLTCSITKLAQTMKNMTNCSTMSSIGTRFGSHLSLVWLITGPEGRVWGTEYGVRSTEFGVRRSEVGVQSQTGAGALQL